MRRVELVTFEGPGLQEARVLFAWKRNGDGWSWRPISCEFSLFVTPDEQRKLLQDLKMQTLTPGSEARVCQDESLDESGLPF